MNKNRLAPRSILSYVSIHPHLPPFAVANLSMISIRKKMNNRARVLEENDWIYDYVNPWGSLLILTTMPYQEECTNITDFVYRLCVSYRLLNSATRGLCYLFPVASIALKILTILVVVFIYIVLFSFSLYQSLD